MAGSVSSHPHNDASPQETLTVALIKKIIPRKYQEKIWKEKYFINLKLLKRIQEITLQGCKQMCVRLISQSFKHNHFFLHYLQE